MKPAAKAPASGKPARSSRVTRTRLVGNQAALRAVESFGAQAKLAVNVPGDKQEQEADATADRVMRTSDAVLAAPGAAGSGESVSRKADRSERRGERGGDAGEPALAWMTSEGHPIQRECSKCREEKKKLQRESEDDEAARETEEPEDASLEAEDQEETSARAEEEGDEAERETEQDDEATRCEDSRRLRKGETRVPAEAEQRIRHRRGLGVPLTSTLRAFFGRRLGRDFGRVRVHTDAEAGRLSKALRAHAFTWGRHVYFAPGRYKPGTPEGLRLLAHELTHTVQQGAAPAMPPVAARGHVPGPSPATPSPGVTEGAPAPSSPAPAPSVIARQPACATPTFTGGGVGTLEGGPEGGTARDFTPPAPSRGTREPTPAQDAAAPTRSEPEQSALDAPAATPADQTEAGASGEREGPAPPEVAPGGEREDAPRSGDACGGGEETGVDAMLEAAGIEAPNAEPSEATRRLAETSPVRAPTALESYQDSVEESVRSRRDAETADTPTATVRPNPTGAVGDEGARDQLDDTPTPEGADLPELATGGGESARADLDQEPDPHAGEAPTTRVEDPSAQLAQMDDADEGGIFGWVKRWFKRLLTAVPRTDPGLNTDPGPSPRPDLSGQADPGQITDLRDDGVESVRDEQARADQSSAEDFGEDDIAADMEEHDETAEVPPQTQSPGKRCPNADNGVGRFEPEDEKDVGDRVRAQTGSRWDAATSDAETREQKRDEDIREGRRDTASQIEDLHTDAHVDQSGAIADARREVGEQRTDWRKRNKELGTGYDAESASMSALAATEIGGECASTTQEIESDREATAQRARTTKADAERDAEKKRNEADQDSGGWLSRGARWLKNKVRDFAQGLVNAVKGIFKKAREMVTKFFKDLKARAMRAIEDLRKWAIGKLEGFRKKLNGLVDRYLGRFPGVARFFKRGINATVDGAEWLVNKTADGLKAGVAFLLDGLAKLINGVLTLYEKFVVGLISFACSMVVFGINLTVLIVKRDLESLLELIRDLPEWHPIMTIMKAGLIGFVNCLRSKPPGERKKFIRKTLTLAIRPDYMFGFQAGVIKGILWDGVIMTLVGIGQALIEVPRAIWDLIQKIKALILDVDAIAAMYEDAKGLIQKVVDFFRNPDAINQVIDFIRKSPEALYAMLAEGMRMAVNWAYKAGGAAAGALFRFIMNNSAFKIGLAVGTVVGQLTLEILLLVFTGGAVNAVKWGAQGAKLMAKAAKLLRTAKKMAGGLIMKGLRMIVRIFRAGLKAAKRLSRPLRGVFQRLERLFNRFMAWIRRAFGGKVSRVRQRWRRWRRRRRRDRDDPADRARWLAFKAELRARLMKGGPRGLKKREARSILRSTARERQFRTVVSRFVGGVDQEKGYYEVTAKRKGHAQWVRVKVLIEHHERWKLAKRKIKRAINLVRAPQTVARFESAIRSFKTGWGFTQGPSVRFDEPENDFEVHGAMSPGATIASKRASRPRTRLTHRQGYMHVYGAKNGLRGGSPPSVSPPYWDDVQPIKTISGLTTLYIRGHLLNHNIGGSGARRDNLTPITRSANAGMRSSVEKHAVEWVKKGKHGGRTYAKGGGVIRYEVTAVGLGGSRPPSPVRCTRQGSGARVRGPIDAERKLAKSISMNLDLLDFNEKTGKWDLGRYTIRESQTNVPPYPAGYHDDPNTSCK
ncbi:MAG: DUF4157 domain-containing protein [Phycisphaerales bacterium]